MGLLTQYYFPQINLLESQKKKRKERGSTHFVHSTQMG